MKRKILTIISLILLSAVLLISCNEAVSVIGASINENGELILEMSDGTTKNAGVVKGKDGETGDKGDTGEQGEKGDSAGDDNPQGLDFYLQYDGTYAVALGKAIYLDEVIIPAEFNGKTVTSIIGFYHNWENYDTDVYLRVKKIIIPSSITNIGAYAFVGCYNLEEVNIPNSVVNIGDYAFNSTNLKNITIPNSVVNIGSWAFSNTPYADDNENWESGCLYIDSYLVETDANVLTDLLAIKDGTICVAGRVLSTYNLTNIVIPSSVTNICTPITSRNITNITVSEENQSYKSIDGNLYSKDGKTLIKYATGKSDTEFVIPDGVISIADYAFYNCNSLKNITLPDGLESIGNYAFFNLSFPAAITIPNSLKYIGEYAFADCYGLEIKYKGSKAEWKNITKGKSWNCYDGGELDDIVYNYTGE